MACTRLPYASGYTGKAPAHFGGLDAGSQAWAVHPWVYLERRAVARGELPLWNRHNGLGEPFLANGQVALLNPFHLIVLADPDSPALWDLHFLLLRFVSALFTCYLLFRLGAPIPIAACGAVPGALHGSFISLVNRADLAAYAVMPLVLYAVVRLRQAPRLRNAALLAGALYLAVTAGHPQPSVAVLLPSGAIGLALLVRERRGRMLGAAAALIAALVTAPYWLPFLANLRGSWTSHGPGTPAAVEPRIALQWIVPGIFASHHMTAFLDGPTPARSFLGAVLGLIAMVGLFAPIATHRRVVWAGTGLALTLLLFGAPAFDALLRLPLLSRVSPAYFEFPALFLLTCAGLLGLEDLRNATPRARIAVVLCAFLLVAGALSLAPVWVSQGLFPGFGRQLALYLPIAAASAALAFAAASANRTPGGQAGCAILLLLGAATDWRAIGIRSPTAAILPRKRPMSPG